MGYNGKHTVYKIGWAILAVLTDCLAIHSTRVVFIFSNYEMILKESSLLNILQYFQLPLATSQISPIGLH